MELQQNEHLILDATSGDFQLTNRRISLQRKEWGLSSKIYLYLEDISSIRTIYTHSIFFLILTILGALATIATFINNNSEYRPNTDAAGICVGATVLFFIFWIASKKRIVSFHPNGGKPLEFYTKGLSQDQIYDMLEKVQIAKTERINELHKIS